MTDRDAELGTDDVDNPVTMQEQADEISEGEL